MELTLMEATIPDQKPEKPKSGDTSSFSRRSFLTTAGTVGVVAALDGRPLVAENPSAGHAEIDDQSTGAVSKLEVHFLNFDPDKEINELGARGIGEIGLAGFAAAMTAAVHHATGVRVRELPIKIEDLLA